MSGFITESVSKISDGFGSALKLLAFLLLTTLAITPVKALFGLVGVIGLIFLLCLLTGFYTYKSLRNQADDTHKAWCGMAAGVLLWQVTRYLPEIPGLGWLDQIGVLYWIGLAVLTLLLWKKVLTTGLKFLLLTFLLNWIGRLYLASLGMLPLMPRFLSTVYPYFHYLGFIGIVASIWWIVMRSRSSIERKYGGLALYFFVLLSFLLF
jgi:hypothetical protein